MIYTLLLTNSVIDINAFFRIWYNISLNFPPVQCFTSLGVWGDQKTILGQLWCRRRRRQPSGGNLAKKSLKWKLGVPFQAFN